MDKDYKKDWNLRFNMAAAVNDKEECERLVDEYVDWVLDKPELLKLRVKINEERITNLKSHMEWLREECDRLRKESDAKSDTIRLLQDRVRNLENDKRKYEECISNLKKDSSSLAYYLFPIGEA